MKRKDTRSKTIVEILSGKVVSVIIGFFANALILPLFGISVDAYETFLTMSVIFVSIAAVRSYLWRRLFNRMKYNETGYTILRKILEEQNYLPLLMTGQRV